MSLGLLGCGFALLQAGDAEAVATRVYAGIGCVKVPGSTGTVGSWNGTVFNNSTSTLNLMCPLVHGGVVNITSAQINLYDRSTTAGAVCTIFNENIAGTSFQDSETNQTTAAATNPTNPAQLTYGFIATGSTMTHTYALCSLPGSTALGVSHLNTILITES
ncbi:MAG TPA: hypothetical protein VGK73_30610 [Polyangiaceae bacterium]